MARHAWKDENYVNIYELRKAGASKKEICDVLEVDKKTLEYWIECRPALAAVFEQTEPNKNGEDEFFYKQLNPEYQAIWDELKKVSKKISTWDRAKMMLDNAGEKARQRLFLHALCVTCFSVNQSMKMVGVSKSDLSKWERDPMFVKLAGQIEWHKKNFIDDAMLKLVARGVPAAVMFAAKTMNKDRGWQEKHIVEHTGEVAHTVKLADLLEKMPLDQQLAILDTFKDMEEIETERRLEAALEDNVVDAEFEERK